MAPAANHDELGNLVTASESDLGTAQGTSRKYAGIVALFALVAVTIGSVSMYRQGTWMQAETKDADIGEIIEACADYTVEATCTAASCNWNGATVKCDGTPAAGKSARPATRSAATTTIVPMREAEEMANCSVTDGTTSSSSYPCLCGSATCYSTQKCTASSDACVAGPTQAPTPAPAGNTGAFEVVVYGISHPDLLLDSTILNAFIAAIKDSYAFVIGNGFLPSHVTEVALSAAAVRRLAAAWPVAGRRMAAQAGTKVKATVAPPPPMTAATALATLASNKEKLNTAITTKVKAIPNIAKVQKGEISASSCGVVGAAGTEAACGTSSAASELLWWAEHGAKYGFAGKAYPMTAQAARGVLNGDSSAGWWLEHGSKYGPNVQMPR
jgi:hypothetical protein